jgi:hypothetical protein
MSATSQVEKNKHSHIEVEIKCFNLFKVLPDSIIFCIGKRRSGKSWLIRELMYILSKRRMPYGNIYSGTEHCNPFFKNFFPKSFIKQDISDVDIANVLYSQKLKVRRYAKINNIDDGRYLNNNMLLVMDDMMSDEDIWKKSKNFKRIFIEGRHYNIMFIMSLQYVLGIPPALRENIDYVFLFASDGSNLKKIWENYAGVVPTFKMFKHIFDICTKDHSCMVIDKTCTSDRLDEKIFYYKAKNPGKFKFGSKAFWEYHDENYKSSDDEDDNETPSQKKLKKIKSLYAVEGKQYEIMKIE